MDAVDYLRDLVVGGRITRDDLLAVFGGSRSRLSEVMNKRRGLSLEQIRRLHFDLGCDAEALLEPVQIEKS